MRSPAQDPENSRDRQPPTAGGRRAQPAPPPGRSGRDPHLPGLFGIEPHRRICEPQRLEAQAPLQTVCNRLNRQRRRDSERSGVGHARPHPTPTIARPGGRDRPAVQAQVVEYGVGRKQRDVHGTARRRPEHRSGEFHTGLDSPPVDGKPEVPVAGNGGSRRIGVCVGRRAVANLHADRPLNDDSGHLEPSLFQFGKERRMRQQPCADSGRGRLVSRLARGIPRSPPRNQKDSEYRNTPVAGISGWWYFFQKCLRDARRPLSGGTKDAFSLSALPPVSGCGA
jgi:hypothetical protein